jgi:hypothetical protein
VSTTGIRRFEGSFACPICGGTEDDKRGNGERCWGFISSDEQYAHCVREEFAGGIALHPGSNTFPHKLTGQCLCGKSHGPEPPRMPASKLHANVSSNGKGRDGGYTPKEHDTFEAALEAAVWGVRQKGFVCTSTRLWKYVNLDGQFVSKDGQYVMAVIRFQDDKNEKIYKTLHRTLQGKFVNSDPPGKLPLFQLPRLAGAAVIFVCEGEKAVIAAEGIGVTATTSSHGAKSGHRSDWSPLAGKLAVHILPDNDPDGEAHAQQVAGLLWALDPRPEVIKIVRLPLVEKGDDIVEWLESLPSDWGPDERRVELERLAAEAPAWAPSSGGNAEKPAPAPTSVDPVALRSQVETWASDPDFRPETLYLNKEFLSNVARLETTDGGQYAAIVTALRKLPGIQARLLNTALSSHRTAVKTQPKAAAADEADGEGTGSGGVTYYVRDNNLWMMGDKKNEKISNFWGRIIQEIIRDDGMDESRSYMVKVEHSSGNTKVVEVPASEFDKGAWVPGMLGASFTLELGVPRVHGHLATSIRNFSSNEIPEKRIYAHLGWRFINNEYVYLHAGGGIAADGNHPEIATELGGSLSRYALPAPPDDLGEVVVAIAAREGLLRLGAPDRPNSRAAAAVAYAAPVRAVLGPSDFGVHASGSSGKFKSSYLRLVLDNVAYDLGGARHQVVQSWRASLNGLQRLAYDAKDSLLAVDEMTSPQAVEVAGRFILEIGDQKSRDRMDKNLKAARCLDPRIGGLVSSGEHDPESQSALGRLLVLRFQQGTINRDRLGECQRNAGDGLYALAMSCFLTWLAAPGQLDAIRAEHVGRVRALAAEFEAALDGAKVHSRHPSAAAELMWGAEIYGLFIQEVGGMNAQASLRAVRDGLIELLRGQVESHRESHPGRRVLDLIVGGLQSGRYYLSDSNTDGVPQANPTACGWRLKSRCWETLSVSERLGTIDLSAGKIYLVPAVVKKLAGEESRRRNRRFEHLDEVGRDLADAGLIDLKREADGSTRFTHERRLYDAYTRRSTKLRYYVMDMTHVLGDSKPDDYGNEEAGDDVA